MDKKLENEIVERLRQLEKDIDRCLPSYNNQGIRGYLKISIHNIFEAMGRKPYKIHEDYDQEQKQKEICLQTQN